MPTLEQSRQELQDNIRSFIVDGQSKEQFIQDTATDALQGNIARETLSELGQDGPATGEVIIEEIEEQTDNSLSKIEEQEQTDNSQPDPQPQPDTQPYPQPEPSEPSQPLQTVGSPQSNSSSSSSSNSSGGVVNRSESGEAPNVVENPATDNGAVDMGITTVGNNSSSSSTSGDSSMIDSIDPKIIAGVAALVVFLMR
jgi:cobalamin biosynthesis Mg chelatase CobN